MNHHTTCSFALVLAFLLAPSLSAQGAVWVVDDDGGATVDFSSLQAAIDTAADGDTLLLRAGNYTAPPAFPPVPLSITDKSLTLIADGGVPVIASNLVIDSLGSSRTVVVRGFELFDAGLQVLNCAGVVCIEDTNIRGTAFTSTPVPISINNSAAVHLNRVTAEGISQIPASSVAIQASASNVHAYDCTFTGGGGYGMTSTGADAVRLAGGFLFASGSTLQGGSSGCGGSGIVLSGATPTVQILDCTLLPGTPATCASGVLGQPAVVNAGSLATLPTSARSFSIDSPGRVGEIVSLKISGEPFDRVILVYSLDPGSLYLPELSGVLQLDGSGLFTQNLGRLSAAGQRQISVTIQPVGLPVVTLSMQMVLVTTSGELVLSGASEMVLLDS